MLRKILDPLFLIHIKPVFPYFFILNRFYFCLHMNLNNITADFCFSTEGFSDKLTSVQFIFILKPVNKNKVETIGLFSVHLLCLPIRSSCFRSLFMKKRGVFLSYITSSFSVRTSDQKHSRPCLCFTQMVLQMRISISSLTRSFSLQADLKNTHPWMVWICFYACCLIRPPIQVPVKSSVITVGFYVIFSHEAHV